MAESAPPLCPKIILEGTRLTRKTELAFALNEHPRVVGPRRYRYHSPVISGEWGGLTNQAWGPSPISFGPEEEPAAVEVFRTWTRLFELHRYYSWIVDRFHLSARADQQRRGRDFDDAGLEERLLPLGFAIVLCTRAEETFASAREERLLVSAKPDQYDDLGVFLAEQRALRRLAAASRLPVLELEVAGRTVGDLAEEVADWLDHRDLLRAPTGAVPGRPAGAAGAAPDQVR